MDGLSSILFFTISMSTPLVLCVLGGLFAYKANVLNIAMEGMMNMGAFASVFFIFQTQHVLLGIMLGVLLALLFGLLFAFFGITLKGNLTVIGLAVNLLIQSLIPFILQVLFNTRSNLVVTDIVSPEQLRIQIPIIKDIPFIGAVLSGHTPLTYLSIIFIVLACVLLYKTRFGKYVRVVGENDQAADSIGIKSNKIKYIAVLISAFMAALAGVNLSVESLGMYTIGMVAGRGFIALAAIYCGRGQPLPCCLYALLFGLARAIQIKLTVVVEPATASLIEMLPYLFIVIIMFVVGFMKNKNNLIRGYKYD